MRTALIAGAGIGGLTAALALSQRGWSVRVLERAGALGEAGAGVQQSPNAMRVHRALGVAAAVEAVGVRPRAAVIRDGRTGRALVRQSLADAEERYGAPYLHLHRADLHAVLLSAARAAGVGVETGVEAEGYEADPPRLLTAAGARGADLIVGADGARSAIRARMHPGAAPRFTGQTAWRALVPADALPPGTIPPEATSWVGRGGHLVTYLVRDRTLVNVVGVRDDRPWAAEDWSQPGDPDAFRAAFAGWDARLAALLGAVTSCRLWGLYDHPPLPRWSDGAVTLLGDAAHPVLPFLAQGAGLAVEDAWVLADALEGRSVAEGLVRYEASRRPRTARVARLSAGNAALFHRRGLGPVKLALGARLPALPARVMAGVYGADVTKGA